MLHSLVYCLRPLFCVCLGAGRASTPLNPEALIRCPLQLHHTLNRFRSWFWLLIAWDFVLPAWGFCGLGFSGEEVLSRMLWLVPKKKGMRAFRPLVLAREIWGLGDFRSPDDVPSFPTLARARLNGLKDLSRVFVKKCLRKLNQRRLVRWLEKGVRLLAQGSRRLFKSTGLSPVLHCSIFVSMVLQNFSAPLL